jgi:diguanylate cyclase (GGDEF)-like protein
MAEELEKHLERAKKSLARNRVQDAIDAYRTALQLDSGNVEILRALGDLYTRQNDAAHANEYWGLLFDRYAATEEAAKAVMLYSKHLRFTPQPPARQRLIAIMMEKQGKPEAAELYAAAAQSLQRSGLTEAALECWERMAALQPDRLELQLRVAELGEKMHRKDSAARAWRRAGQLALAEGDTRKAREWLEHANELVPEERTTSLALAETYLTKSQTEQAVAILRPLEPACIDDPAFLALYGEALMQEGHLGDSERILERLYRIRPDGFDRLFDLTSRYLQAKQSSPAMALLGRLRQRLAEGRRIAEFEERLHSLWQNNRSSSALGEYCAAFYQELNREVRLFEVLSQLFDVYFSEKKYDQAADALEQLVDIDAYEGRQSQRLQELQGKADPRRLSAIRQRIDQASTVRTPEAAKPPAGEVTEPVPFDIEGERLRNQLEDMMVQVEIFLRYSLRAKAIEKLDRIAALYPEEVEGNERLRTLFAQADYWPKVVQPAARVEEPTTPVSDLAKISEITHAIYRQAVPRGVVATAVNEIGKYLRVSRCLGAIGAPGGSPTMAAVFCAPGMSAWEAGDILKLLSLVGQQVPDAAGLAALEASQVPEFRSLDIESGLAVTLMDKEHQVPAGVLLVEQSGEARRWKPSEVYLLKTLGDQMVIAVNHARLRSLMKTLSVADERTGLLSRGSYLDCLLSEMSRAKVQGTPLAVAVVELDHGQQIARQFGEMAVNTLMEQLAQGVLANVRQNDIAVRYGPWSVGLLLPDTTAANAKGFYAKLGKVTRNLKLTADANPVSMSAAICEAAVRPDYDVEDAVTDLINRIEFSLEEAHRRGGNCTIEL